MSAGKVILYIIGAAGLLGITYAFFWGIGFVNETLFTLDILVYSQTVWIMSGILAGLIVFSAIAKGHVRLEMLSSASFLIYVIFAYTIGCSILSFFMPYNGFGVLNVNLATDLSTLLPEFGKITVALVYANTLSAIILVVSQGLRFMNTFVKSMKRFKEERPATVSEKKKAK